jgi:hypothetical protein
MLDSRNKQVFSTDKLLDLLLLCCNSNSLEETFEMNALFTFNSLLMQDFDENDNPLVIQERLKSCHSSTSAMMAADVLF